jgi:hypothetical protein
MAESMDQSMKEYLDREGKAAPAGKRKEGGEQLDENIEMAQGAIYL